MPITIAPFTWIMRGGPDHHKYGDPYEWAAQIVEAAPGVARVIALRGEKDLNLEFVKGAGEALRSAGFKQVVWERSQKNDSEKGNRREGDRRNPWTFIEHEL